MKNSKLILLLLFSIYKLNLAQLSIDAFTNKDNYEYGEQIELYCKITNNSDSTFEFFAGNYETCQAEFSFNDFNSWEHTSCLSTNELLTFKPHSSKIYKWKIDPQSLGLPNKDGYQTIICNYFFDLKDTVIINAPKFIGGEIILSYDRNKYDIVNNISNSLNADIVFGSDYGDTIHEVWQIEGFDIDSLVQIYSEDSIFVSFEKSHGIAYDKIYDENPFDYYPLQIGNKWIYNVQRIDYDSDYYPNERNYIVIREVKDEILMNDKKYFSIMATNINSGFVEYSFERIDSAQGKIYKYDESFENTKEFLLENLTLEKDQNFESFVNYQNELYETDIYFTSTSIESIFDDSEKIQTKSFEFNCVYFSNYTLSIGIGKTSHFSTIIDGFDEYWILKAAFINGKIYGDTTLVGIESDKSQTIPTNFSLSQNYPNPFNPTTTIEYSVPNVETQNFASLKLVVYDVLGREVATLVNQKQKPGNYKIEFDGSYLPSGVYYYQLKTNNFTQSKKMIMLK